MRRIDSNDWIKNIKLDELEADEFIPQNDERPLTATKKFSDQDIASLKDHLSKNKPPEFTVERPETSAIIKPPMAKAYPEERKIDPKNKFEMPQSKKPTIGGIKVKQLEIVILDTWGDIFYTGLNGIEVIGTDGKIEVKAEWMDAKPRDMNSIPGYSGDLRVLENLVNGRHESVKDKDIWLIPYTAGEEHTIKITFPKAVEVKGIKFFNYNKSEEDSLRGVRTVLIKANDKLLTPRRGVVIKKASGKLIPGHDFGHFISLPFSDGWIQKQIIPLKSNLDPPHTLVFQEYDTLSYPIGFVFKFNLYSTHGDFHYIGLNGVEIFDQNGN